MSARMPYLVTLRRIVEEEVEMLAEPMHDEQDIQDQLPPDAILVSFRLKMSEDE